MKAWYLECSKDADMIDFETVIYSEEEPDFLTCYNLAEAHDCPWFTISEEEDPAQADAMYLIDTFNNAEEVGNERTEVAAVLLFCDYSDQVKNLLTCWNYHSLNRLIDSILAEVA